MLAETDPGGTGPPKGEIGQPRRQTGTVNNGPALRASIKRCRRNAWIVNRFGRSSAMHVWIGMMLSSQRKPRAGLAVFWQILIRWAGGWIEGQGATARQRVVVRRC